MEVGECVICQGTDGFRDDDRLCENCRGMFCECGGLILSNGCCATCGNETATIEDEVARLNRRLVRERGVDIEHFGLRFCASDGLFMDELRTRFGDEFCALPRLAREAVYIQVSHTLFPIKLPKEKK